MDGVGVGDGGRGQQCRRVEIAFRGRGLADAHAFIGEAHVHGVGVGGGMDRHGADSHFLAGAVYPQRDFTPVGNQDLVEHTWLHGPFAGGLVPARPIRG
jgi:hypothetical protein